MLRSTLCVILAVVARSLSPSSPSDDPPTARAALVIRDVSVIDTKGGPTRGHVSVTILGDRIASIAADIGGPRPRDAIVVDGRGKFLIPGLWDMHVHLDYQEYLPLFIANGVTGVRVMSGAPKHQQWRQAIDHGDMLGPRMMIGSPIIDGPHPYWSTGISVSNEAEAREAVAAAKRQGADFVKVYQFLPRDLYLAIADEARKEAIPFAGHLPVTVSAEEGSRVGQKSFEHLVGILPAVSIHQDSLFLAAQQEFAALARTGPSFEELHDTRAGEETLSTYSDKKVAALAAVLRENQTWQCPTLVLLRMFAYGNDPQFLHDARLRYVPPRMRDSWDPSQLEGPRSSVDFAYSRKEYAADLSLVRALNDQGVGMLAGTDTQNPYIFYGFSLHDELGLLVQAGLSPLEALRAATLNPSRFFGMERDLGTVETGKLADLVLLDRNPLEAIANTQSIDAVIYRGRLYTRTTLDGMMRTAERLAGRPLIGAVLLAAIQAKGVKEAVRRYHQLRTEHPNDYDFSEAELIACGYRLIHRKQYKEAIEIFKLSVEAYPQSYNTYDSLAEAYMNDGNFPLAIQNYRTSLELNPANLHAKAMIAKMAAH